MLLAAFSDQAKAKVPCLFGLLPLISLTVWWKRWCELSFSFPLLHTLLQKSSQTLQGSQRRAYTRYENADTFTHKAIQGGTPTWTRKDRHMRKIRTELKVDSEIAKWQAAKLTAGTIQDVLGTQACFDWWASVAYSLTWFMMNVKQGITGNELSWLKVHSSIFSEKYREKKKEEMCCSVSKSYTFQLSNMSFGVHFQSVLPRPRLNGVIQGHPHHISVWRSNNWTHLDVSTVNEATIDFVTSVFFLFLYSS